ncbi:hypothetical protein DJ013_00920 [Arcticibacterium luteifluviistationis]|uniref:Transposase IS801/IS1294 domain-containing protein n=1 Tax=Arcticibacterium luteifluviistationis TaxID=1784714 RepID=A0A2Z4G6P9_9BACT|nr:hypothetical protein DJ013_00920 [Arcticibacterium luteifluviistationis]
MSLPSILVYFSSLHVQVCLKYTHKVAISNHRLLYVNDSQVSFSYKDYNRDCLG